MRDMEVPFSGKVIDRQSRGMRLPSLKCVLIGIVVAFVGFLILAPIGALIMGASAEGLGAIVEALRAPDVLRAFWLTLFISLIIVVAHAVFGTIVAWVLVRHTFPGRRVVNALIDLPFAV